MQSIKKFILKQSDGLITTGVSNIFTISFHLGTVYCQRVPLLPGQLI